MYVEFRWLSLEEITYLEEIFVDGSIIVKHIYRHTMVLKVLDLSGSRCGQAVIPYAKQNELCCHKMRGIY
jgi:hypothetical protein